MRRPICPCLVEGSVGIDVQGSGDPDDPYSAHYKLSEDAGNLLVKGPNGLRMHTPTQLSARPMVKAFATETQSVNTEQPRSKQPYLITYDGVYYDTGGFWDGEGTFTVPRSGLYSLGAFTTVGGNDEETLISAGTSIMVDELIRIVQEGARIRLPVGQTLPSFSSDPLTQYELEQGQTVQVWWEPFSTNSTAELGLQRYFYMTFRGD